MSYPRILYQFPECAGESYRPSNGFEGDVFDGAFCSHCVHDWKFRETRDGEDGCEILRGTLFLNVGDEGYPKEWVWDDEGWPICTKFKRITDEL